MLPIPRIAAVTAVLIAANAAGEVLETSASNATVPPQASLLAQDPESGRAVIGAVYIDAGNIFDPDDPQQSRLIHRLMNSTHAVTHEEVIRQQLLFSPGDEFASQTIEESQRLLRSNKFLADASIQAASIDDGEVDIHVKTTDAWSLTPSISFSRGGGVNTGGVRLEESNLLGTGSELEVAYKSEIDRETRHLRFRDPQLGSSRFDLEVVAASNSDGDGYLLRLEQPFYSLNASRAGGLKLHQFDQIDALYEFGEPAREINHDALRGSAWYGWSSGLSDGWTRRWKVGVAADEHTFTDGAANRAADFVTRQDRYPFLGFEVLEDDFEMTRNVDHLHRTEDRHYGLRFSASLGYATPVLGSDDEAWITRLDLTRALRLGTSSVVELEGALTYRNGGASPDAYLFETTGRYYLRQSDARLFVVKLSYADGNHPDSDEVLSLGGDTGLRAYPVRYLNGDRRLLLNIEQRVFTDWYPFHLFRIGAAAYLDVGRVWGLTSERPDVPAVLSNVGVGLRIGSPHSSTGRMVHVDVAYPLDGPPSVRGPQLVIETRKKF